MPKRLISLLLCAVMSVALAGCSQNKEADGPDYADDEAMSIIADGLQKRSDVIDKQNAKQGSEDVDNATYAANLKEAVQTEIDAEKSLKTRQFKDSKMQEAVISYLNLLDDSMDVLKNYSPSSTDFYTEWQKVYDKRTSMLKTFVDDYGLTVDEKYKDTLSDLTANGAAATKKSQTDETIKNLIESATFEKQDQGYGSYTYSAVIENTSKLSFKNVSIVLSLYDADGVKQEAYANANTWAAGEKVKFEAYSDVNANEVKASVQYYDVED
ncbi:hypothetical protein GFD21_03060 [Bifidobacterium sp. SMA15]|uniref:DUF5105 domain-containing protein n=2 Tax=Bifidobacterium platyrrhinorum TaxID=2661628 RepID=A0A6L9SUE9_9BIFI|nr:hypothetical protein [Bifidobacterium platyrrhinorum]